MCGIVGLFLKNTELEPKLGSMIAGMLATMCDRGPDSAGFAVYGAGESGHVKLTVRATSPDYDFAGVARQLSEAIGFPVSVEVRDSHGVFSVPAGAEQKARKAIEASRDDVGVVELEHPQGGADVDLHVGIGELVGQEDLRGAAAAEAVAVPAVHGQVGPCAVVERPHPG